MDDLVEQLEKALEQSEQREAQLNDRVSALEDILYLTEANLEAAEQRGYANAMEAERKLHEDRIEELEANINIKADFIDATINQLAASDQRIEELEAKLGEYNLLWQTYELDKVVAVLKGQNDE